VARRALTDLDGGLMPTTNDAAIEDVLGGLHVIDCDAHFTEPPDLWTSRVPASMQDKVPVMKTVKGRSLWFLNDHLMMHTGGNTIRKGGKKLLGVASIGDWQDIDESSWDAKARLRLMDDMGVWSQILYPNAIGFASNTLFSIEDLEQRSLLQQVYNDFLMDVQDESAGRLLPQAVLPVWDMDLTLKEMTRLRERGITGFTISDKPHTVGLPDLDSEYFAPMWSLGNEMGAVFNFHIASGVAKSDKTLGDVKKSGNPLEQPNPDMFFESYGPQRRLAILATQFYMSNARIIINLCMGGFFDRYPGLKIFSAESGIGWVPFILEAMEYQLDEMVTDPAELAVQSRRPTEYFRDHIYVSFWFERSGPAKLIEEIGVNNVLIETDVPHPTCIFPNTRSRIAEVMSTVSPEVRRRVLQDNAVDLFGLTLPAS